MRWLFAVRWMLTFVVCCCAAYGVLDAACCRFVAMCCSRPDVCADVMFKGIRCLLLRDGSSCCLLFVVW